MIYFVQGDITQRVKIGFTESNIYNRMSQLQTGSPDRLKLIGARLGNRYFESTLHELFWHHRCHGEWFEPVEEIFQYIKANCTMDIYMLDHVNIAVSNQRLKYDDTMILKPKEIEKMGLLLLEEAILPVSKVLETCEINRKKSSNKELKFATKNVAGLGKKPGSVGKPFLPTRKPPN